MKTFSDFPIHPLLHKALADLNFTEPTPIQRDALAPLLEGKDLIGCAQTGTGKTAAFLLPIFTRLIESKEDRALVLVPTRELAAQVAEMAQKLLKHVPQISGCLLIGGAPMMKQINRLRTKPRVIVATPGRLIDHLEQRTLELSGCRYLVLDEADRMLDMGFAPQLQQILRRLPTERQSMLFSATIPPDILSLSKNYMRNPVRVSVDTVASDTPKITQEIKEVSADKKGDLLLSELSARTGLILVFARTQIRSDRVARLIRNAGHAVTCIHGGKRQNERERAIKAFKSGAARILVATDIAARGIDISGVEHVINYDLPQAPEDYVHRIGRTGRAGREGMALSLISPDERKVWAAIHRAMNPGAKGVNGGAGSTHSPRSRHNGSGGGGGRRSGGGFKGGGRRRSFSGKRPARA